MTKEYRGRPQQQRHKQQVRRLGISKLAEEKIMARLLGQYNPRSLVPPDSAKLPTICSAAWAEAQFRTISDTAPDGSKIVVRLYEPHGKPPPGMPVCLVCGVPTPAPCMDMARMVCLDCHVGINADLQGQWGRSPLHEVMEVIRMLRIKPDRWSRSR